MRLVELKTSKEGEVQAFNPLYIIKVGPTNQGNTFLEVKPVNIARGRVISSWTVYEPYGEVVAKINIALENNEGYL